jgi:hypothetical protein
MLRVDAQATADNRIIVWPAARRIIPDASTNSVMSTNVGGGRGISPTSIFKNTNKLVLKSASVMLHLCIIKTAQENKQNLL